jgi:hypothetical protein
VNDYDFPDEPDWTDPTPSRAWIVCLCLIACAVIGAGAWVWGGGK